MFMAKMKKHDIDMAIKAAEGFRELSKVFTNKLGNDLNKARDIALNDLGGMIASSTNLSFAIELYIKAVIGELQIQIPEHHDLLSLYEVLPSNLRKEIEKNYNKGRDDQKAKYPTLVSEIHLALSSSEISDEELEEWDDNNPKDIEHSIESMLTKHKNMFVTWRYIYEVESDDLIVYYYPYSYLDLLCEVLSSLLTHLRN